MAGLEDLEETESAETTTATVMKYFQEKMKVKIEEKEIDIAHRLPMRRNGKRDVVVKFCSRLARNEVLRQKKDLKTTGYYLNGGLTRLNQYILTCVRKMKTDEVEQARSFNGNLFYKNRERRVEEVRYEKYQEWVDFPWRFNKTGARRVPRLD